MNGEQEKFNRLLKTISMLKEPFGRSIKSMAEELDVHKRTISRYIKLLEVNGFPVDQRINSDRWFLVSDENQDKSLLNFDIDEANLIKDLVEKNAFKNNLKDGILHKLYINSDLKPLAKNLVDARLNGIVNKLKRAVKKEYKIILQNYHSLNGNAIKNYTLEPHGFSSNYLALFAYDINSKTNKQFKICRIGDVIVLDKKQTHIKYHVDFNLDVFGFQGEEWLEIILKLNLAAVTLLRETYPQSYPFLTKNGEDHYIFHGVIYHVEGAGRFVMGQLDNIEIIKGEVLIDYVKEKLHVFENHYMVQI